MYNLACAYSLENDSVSALAWLERAIDNGMDFPSKMARDPDLANVRSVAAFETIAAKARDLSLETFRDHRRRRTNAEQWAPAIDHFSTYVRDHPGSGRGWFNLAFSQHYSGYFTDSAQSFQRAAELGYHSATSYYNAACAYARPGNSDEAFRWLRRASEAGFNVLGNLKGDEDLDSLRDDPRFEEYRVAMREAEEASRTAKLEQKRVRKLNRSRNQND